MRLWTIAHLGIACFIGLTGCATADPESDGDEQGQSDEGTGESQEGVANTIHAIITCPSTPMYGNYSPSAGPQKPVIATLAYGNKVGLKPDAGYPSWAVILDYGPNKWGYVARSCLTTCNGTNNPIAGCF